MNFKERILDALDELEVTPETVAEQLAQAIKGKTVTEKFDKNNNLMSRTVKTTPEDTLRGAMLYDAMNGGQLGLAPKTTSFRRPTEIAHKRMSVDTRIIVTSDDAYQEEE